MASELTYKQRRFVAFYLGESNGNATDAARRAGYRNPETIGRRLVRKSTVSAQIDAQLKEEALVSGEILARLSEQATSGLHEFIRINKRGAVSLRLDDAKRRGKLGMVKKLKRGKYGWEIELYDAQRALELLGKYRGLWKDRDASLIDAERDDNLGTADERLAGLGADRHPAESGDPDADAAEDAGDRGSGGHG